MSWGYCLLNKSKLDWYLFWAILGMIAIAGINYAKAADYSDYTTQMEEKYDLPKGLLTAICYTENHWRNAPGSAGELGVCQLKPSTVRHVFGSNSLSEPLQRPILALGSRGHAVVDLNLFIAKDLGIKGFRKEYPLNIFNEDTKFFVVLFQKKHHLWMDGIVGEQTWRSLIGSRTIEQQLQDPHTNIEYAAKYIEYLRNKLGSNNTMVLACAYNGGEQAKYCSIDYLNKVDSYLKAHNET